MSRRSTLVLALFLTAGCAGVLGRGPAEEEPDPDRRFRAATVAADEGDFGSAGRHLRRLASRCESGERGREAVLLLAAVEVDPRNPDPSPAAAAHLAARYLQMPEAPAWTLTVAGTLYLTALDLGANPVRDPFAPIPSLDGTAAEAGDEPADEREVGPWRVARRFEDCGAETAPARTVRELPEHPGTPLWRAVQNARAERDSLARRADSLEARADEARRLRARVDSLEAELRRIRSLLQQNRDVPNTSPEDEP